MDIFFSTSLHFNQNIEAIFTLNFTMLAFIITAITILLMLDKGMIVKFKKADLLSGVLDYFTKSLHWNFISGVFALIVWIINISNKIAMLTTSALSIILLFIALYFTYQSYKFLIFFVKKQ